MDAKIRRREIALVLGIIIIAIFFRAWNLNTDEAMGDEGNYAIRGIGWNDFMISGSLTTPWNWFIREEKLPFWTQLSFNDHPPLHFFFLWLSSHIFGISLFAVRLPSVFFGILSILGIFYILRREGYFLGAYIAAYFFAILPWHIYISRQAIQESQVMFWVVASLVILSLLKKNDKNIFLWLALGSAVGFGFLAKYSMAISLPVIAMVAFHKRWFFHRTREIFWSACVCLFLLSPVIVYNYFVFQERKHFDLQVTRFLKMSTSGDWPASTQMLWEGNIGNLLKFFSDLVSWLSVPAVLAFLASAFFLCYEFIKYSREKKNVFIRQTVSFVTISAMMSVLIVLTLRDFARASIIIPFFVLAFGVCIEKIFQNKKLFAAGLLLITFFTLFTVALGGRVNKKIFPVAFAYPFTREPLGFEAWEKWQRKNFNIQETPVHYASLKDWLHTLARKINETQGPVIIYDPRISWYQLNWYFYRHSLYSKNIPVVHLSFLQLMNELQLINLQNKNIYYIQTDVRGRDLKAGLDDFSKKFDNEIYKKVIERNILPIILADDSGAPLLKIWNVPWTDQ